MTTAESLATAPRRYWKYALWTTVGITLAVLLLDNVLFLPVEVSHIITAVVFSLVSALAMKVAIRQAVDSEGRKAMKAFFAYAVARLLVAVALIAGYMAVTGVRGRALLPFVIVLSVYYLVLDVLDAVSMTRVLKALESGR